MNLLQHLWQNYINYILEFNIVQKAIISIVLAFIILASMAAIFFLIMDLV